ncbi:alpha/beta-Hydrolases superfamily protein [Arabidopsis thaliana]|uniref:Alpha/beta-Hydrolases superfamily protein n=1 Tax=Arabidopsis thaliana TaxID=3702 RepID=A0A1P8AWS9_ARATH|nr:alpha/beta-Hydrolases superfamily protein [Arabidopsis thaliana]ANM61119.1 alpha/beta-Hydrolases superfamily protein [Arabidopsis thaliana]|eukprot:NP_001323356.1 alpha/beta-Hydrolases superfamily protein [Arabidopsis thaliana]
MGDSPASSNRVKLRDGRFLAYKERGVPKEKAKYKIILVHGFGSSKDMNFSASKELIEELEVYLLFYDRSGYGASDSNTKRSLESEVEDIAELADQLELGPKFYLIGISMGSYPTWGCLRHIPHRLSGVAFVAPVVNYRWPSLPKKLIKKDYRTGIIKWGLRISKYAPGLLHWWIIQKLFASTSSVLESNPVYFNSHDIEVLKRKTGKATGKKCFRYSKGRFYGLFRAMGLRTRGSKHQYKELYSHLAW